MEYRQHQLSNGLSIVAEVNPEAYTAAFGFFVRTGARDESPEIAGVSHFLEHMVFKGTPTRSAADVNAQLDEIGSNSNAMTGEDSTVYYAAVLPEFQTEVVDLLCDLMRPALRQSDFETEKQVIIEEIRMYNDQPPYGGFEKAMEAFFGGHSLGNSVLGTETTVGEMTPDQMFGYFQSRYCPSNIGLSAAGQVDFDRLVEQVEMQCGAWPHFNPSRVRIKPEYQSGFLSLHQPNSTQQYIIQLAAGPSVHDELRYAARIMSAIFGDDGSSRLYWEFLDTGLAESAGTGIQEYDECGAMSTYICCEPEQAQENLERLLRLQQEFVAGGVTERELELAKRKVASAIVLGSERTESRMFSVGSQWLTERPFKSVAEVAAAYEAVTLDQVNEALRLYRFDENMTLTVGPSIMQA